MSSAWATYKSLPLRMKVAVALAAPLWLPVALAAWLEARDERINNATNSNV